MKKETPFIVRQKAFYLLACVAILTSIISMVAWVLLTEGLREANVLPVLESYCSPIKK